VAARTGATSTPAVGRRACDAVHGMRGDPRCPRRPRRTRGCEHGRRCRERLSSRRSSRPSAAHSPLPHGVVDGAEDDVAVTGREGRVRNDGGVAAAPATRLTRRLDADRCDDRGQDAEGGGVQRELDRPPAPGSSVVEERREDAVHKQHAGRDVHHRDGEPHGRPVRHAHHRHQARFGLDDDLRAGVVCLRAARPEPVDRRVDSTRGWRRGDPRNRGRVGGPRPAGSSRRRSRRRLRRACERLRPAATPRSTATLCLPRSTAAKYVLVPFQKGGPPGSRVVSAARALDLDDVRAEVGKEHGGVGA